MITKEKTQTFSESEREAMKARTRELKKSGKTTKDEDLKAVLDAIEAMEPQGRPIGERLHKIITSAAPDLSPKTWYGMPAYANKDGKVVCFFRPAEKFKERYLTLGFNQEARLDEGRFWPIAYALTGLGDEEEKQIAELVKRAAG